MQKTWLPMAEQFAKQNKRKSIWRKLVRFMACVVVFCTTYALILPAITMERPLCELEEHVHSDSCYSKLTTRQVAKLICSYDTLEVHKHTAECRNEEQELVCGLADFVVHEHDASCRDEKDVPVCVLPEIKEHEHTEECYRTETQEVHEHGDSCYSIQLGERVCALEETEGHTHGEGCSETVLNCDLTVQPHVHADSCWLQLVCELPEDENHTHSEECSGCILNCELTEQPHIHEDSCYISEDSCELEETEGHTHTDACYEQLRTLICQPEETEAPEPELICEEKVVRLHTHDEKDCYETYLDEDEKEQVRLICQETVVEEHIHGESCFVTEEVPLENVDMLMCGLEEDESHSHTDRCYGAWVLICGKQEHTHNEICSPEPEEPDTAVRSGPTGYAYRDTVLMRFSAPRTENSITYHTDIAPLFAGVRILNATGDLVYSSEDPSRGTQSVRLGEKCRITLFFKESTSDQFETKDDAALTYRIPSNLSSDLVDTGEIVTKNNEKVADYRINNNELVITPVLLNGENFFGQYHDVNLEIEFDAEVIASEDSEDTEIGFEDNHVVTIKVVEDGRLEAEKKELAYDPVTQTITYECTATAYGGTVSLTYIDDWWWPANVSVIQDSICIKDAEGNDVTDGWTYARDEDGEYFSLTPQSPVSLKHGESIALIYQMKVNEGVDENFEFTNEFAVHGNFGTKELYDKATVTTQVLFSNVEKSGAYYSESVDDAVLDALEWTVEIDNSDLNEITITDKLGPGQTFCKHKPIYIRGIKTDGTRVESSIDWDDVTCNEENNQFVLTLPSEPLPDGKYEFADYKLVYYSHYTLTPNGPDIQYFENTVETNILIGDKPNTGTASVGVLGVPPGIRKGVTADDDWLTFTVECFMPAGLNNRTSVLLYDTLASWGNISGYIDQDPDSLTVTISPAGGTAYALQPYADQESAEGTYLLVPEGQSFTLYFNTGEAAAAASRWSCDVDSTLTVSYRISLDAPMLDDWGGEPNGETLREFLERTGQMVQNEAQLNYAPTDSIKAAVSWTPPKKPEPNLKKSAKAAQADGVYDYSVWFNTGDSQSCIFKETSYENGDGELLVKNDILSLELTDVFDSRMEYVPGSLKVLVWNAWDHADLIQVYQLGDDKAPSITTNGETTTMVISAADLTGAEDHTDWLANRSLMYGLEYLRPGYQYEFVYQLRVKDEVKLSATEGVLELDNTASITWTDSEGPNTVEPAHNRVSYDTRILQKDMVAKEDRNLVQFTILVNRNALDLAADGDSYILYDTMSSNLALLYNTLSVQVLDKTTGEVERELTPAQCQFAYNPAENQITLLLPDESMIRISYNCAVHGVGGETTQVQNTVELKGRSLVQDVVSSEFAVRDHQGWADASSGSFYLQKQNGNNHNVLEGAVFQLYGEVESDTPDDFIMIGDRKFYYYCSHTTDSSGIAYIEDSQLKTGFLYALVEKTSPIGYMPLEEPYLFYMEERPYDSDLEIPCIANGELVVIENFPYPYLLPKTGGAGTVLYTTVGLLLTAAAVLLYSHSQKRRRGAKPSF